MPGIGEPAPWFHADSSGNPRYAFDTVAGRYIVMLFFGSAARADSAAVLTTLLQVPNLFDDHQASLFGISHDPSDKESGRIRQRLPGFRLFWDFDGKIAALYRVCAAETAVAQAATLSPIAYVLSPSLQVLGILRMDQPQAFVERLVRLLSALPRIPPPAPAAPPAPVLVVPWVFDRDLCRELIGLYDREGGVESGFMREVDGKTVGAIAHSHKKRFDHEIADPAIRGRIVRNLSTRLVPMIERAFQFRATRIERYIVACYDAEQGGYFRPHRDNTTPATAHRRFAVTVNLNAEEYDGGDLKFPEFGQQSYRAPTGGAVVFSCSLLHEALSVTRGRRYACLPFLYDDVGARMRAASQETLVVEGSLGDVRHIPAAPAAVSDA